MNFLNSEIFVELIKSFEKTFIREDRWKLFVQGLGNTLQIALFATLLGVALGVLVAIIKVLNSQNGSLKFLNMCCSLYITVIRGTPVVVQLMITYFIIFKNATNAIPIAILAFGINSGAYVAEIVRGGILAVDKGQTEAGRSLGLTSGVTMRKIVLPQAIKNILPSLGNEFIAILKETSVAGYIGAVELTKAADIVRSRTYDAFFSLITVAVIYLILVIGISSIMKVIERRLARSDRG
jgi:His/Glu/Gln/Arg/opine family amino acid ABC transporter permease subunit